MKRLSLSFLLLITAIAAHADLTVEQKLEGPMIAGNATMKMKGDLVRMDIPAGPAGTATMIIDLAKGEMATVIHQMKMVMRMNSAQLQAAAKAGRAQLKGNDSAATEKPLTPTATGKKEKIGDYDCEIYTATMEGVTAKAWISTDKRLAPIRVATDRMAKSALSELMKKQSPDLAFATVPGAIVKTETAVMGQTMTSTLVSFKEVPVAASEFQVPADYTEQKMPEMPVPAL
jgi:hypothetical protein